MRRSAFLSWPVVRLALAAPVAAGLALAAAAAVAPVPAAQAATTTTFTYTGSEQTYPVPAGVTAVTITTVGAPGGTDDHGDTAGGNGASVTARVPLPANTTTLDVEVGGPGAPTVDDSPAVGGFNGGGGSGILSGGSGGAASDVRTTSCGSSCNTNDPASLASRLVVAGGGGGAGANFGCGGPGGTAGDTSVTGAGNGGAGSACGVVAGGNGGFGGTAGGTGGAADAPFICPGDNGSLGQGGDAPTSCDPNNFGGGGGGGYYGGGGDGQAGGGGGAGSSFWVAGATGTSMSEDTTSTPEVEITPVMVSVTNPGNQTSTVGTAVSLQIQATDSASGQSLTYSATGLPAGLSISSSGLISGTPTTAGSSRVTVTAADTTGTNGSASFTWTVTSALLTVTTTSLPGATLGSAYSAALAAAGGIPPYSWSVTAGSLPPGLSLSSSGTISGTPAEAGTYSVTIQAADSSSPRQTATAQLSITVGGCTTSITGSHSGQIVVGKGQFVCIGPGASQNGAITVTSGGGLSVVGSTLIGGISTSGAVSLGLSGSTINGSVSLTNDNGPSVVSSNAIVGSLSCSGNNPPPVDNGRANKVSGKSSGQCSALG